MVDAMLFIARTGCQWRYLPERYGTWTAVWAQYSLLRQRPMVTYLVRKEPTGAIKSDAR